METFYILKYTLIFKFIAGHHVKHVCKSCEGKGVIENQHVEEELQIPKGITENQKIRFTNKGHASDVYNAPPGDLLGTLKIKTHEKFRRKGHDIISEVPISISQAILGSKIKIETINGEKDIEIDGGVTTETRYIIKESGAPYLYPDEKKSGDHILKFKIVIPHDLNEKQIELVMKLKSIESESGDISQMISRSLATSNRQYKIYGEINQGYWNWKNEQKPSYMEEDKPKGFIDRFRTLFSASKV